MNTRKLQCFLHYSVAVMVCGILLGTVGCSKKAIKAGSSAATTAEEASAAVETGSSMDSGLGDNAAKMLEFEIDSPRKNATRVGEELIVVRSGSMEGARAQGGESSLAGGHLLPGSDESADQRIFGDTEHVPASMIVVAAQPELLVPEPISGTAPPAPSVASAAVETFVIQPGFEDIYFDFDQWTVSKEMQGRLSEHAQWLKANPREDMFIEGYCDVRGSREYNMVLGEKRARSVSDFLVDLGVKEQRITLISYGKERVKCFENEESCHEGNRRAHLVLK